MVLRHRTLTCIPCAFGVSFVSLLLVLLFVFLADRCITRHAAGRHFSSVDQLPAHAGALVLGCSERLTSGATNHYFRYRIETAARVFHAGKCDFLIVSGDHGRKDYNEPGDMKRALEKLGVPPDRIVEDFAGFRTLDSVVRAGKIFGQNRLLVISQRFHNERAIYIGSRKGVELTGMNAEDVTRLHGWKTRVREKLARTKTILDLHLFGTRPRFLGARITIPELIADPTVSASDRPGARARTTRTSERDGAESDSIH